VGSGQAELIVITQDGTPGRRYPLSGNQIDIGSGQADIQLSNDPYVSALHARLYKKNGSFSVRDLDSVNGVYLRVRKAQNLSDGDLVLIGLEVLRFELVRNAEDGLGAAEQQGTQIFGSPASPRYARLCQRTVEGVTRDVFYITRNETTIGRESGDIVFTSDPFMSRRHAQVTRDTATGQFTLRDLGSSNGTYLAIRGEVPLHSGDYIRVGQHLFRLHVDGGSV
jgi:pSer/pThr/pTyr-binding forkhead associated (FHA) protein